MPIPYETPIGSWARRSTFFWAATGATVGLSNLWKFPPLAGENGGGLFVLLYLACLLLVTLPLMLTETALGRHARHGVVLAVDGLAHSNGLSRQWAWLGRFSVLASFLVLSFTGVIGAICLAYVFFGALGRFVGASELSVAQTLGELVENPSNYRDLMTWQLAFLGLVMAVSLQGVVVGLERAFRVVVPTFLLLLLALLAYSYHFGELHRAADYMLGLRPEQMTWQSLQLALAHAFYTLGLGMGVWVAFGAYMPSIAPLKRSVFAVVLMDTLIAILAGLVIYALVFRTGGTASEQGFALVFLALPASLADAPASQFVVTAAFIAILLVAWTTSLALFEPVVGWFQEWTGAPRGWSVIIIGSGAWLAGLGTLFSFSIWSDVTFQGGTVFRWVELLASGLLIPGVSVALTVLVAWKLTSYRALSLIGRAPRFIASVWFWVLKLILPLVVVYIGAHYAWTSLSSLCEGSEKAVWCEMDFIDSLDSSELPGLGLDRNQSPSAKRGHRPLPDNLQQLEEPLEGPPLPPDHGTVDDPAPDEATPDTPDATPEPEAGNESQAPGASDQPEIRYHSV
ncbi:sodium-dependent transporter [Marinobacter salicampi]|uniref:sodium-dependent transporter n=1 Tax=Marinobacter salicampi TaxID=435907 RepID=UPI00140B2988|nr:sodium-dependent transporter [Marinobacter salicampi]